MEGQDNTASGIASHAEGFHTLSAGVYSHTEGSASTVTINGHSAHAEG